MSNTSILKVRGVVDSGQHLVRRLYENDELLSKALGVKLHPGSINLFVSAVGHPELSSGGKFPFFPRDDFPIPDHIRARGVLCVRDCLVNGYAAFALRTEHPGRAFDGPNNLVATRMPQPNTMFEIVAQFIPGIAYGAEVDFVFDTHPTKLRTARV